MKKNGIFSFLYRTRIKMCKGETPVLNLSLLFCLIAVLTAPWLVILGVIAALVMGYQLSVERNADGFSGNFQQVVNEAAATVKSAVDSLGGNDEQPHDPDAEA